MEPLEDLTIDFDVITYQLEPDLLSCSSRHEAHQLREGACEFSKAHRGQFERLVLDVVQGAVECLDGAVPLADQVIGALEGFHGPLEVGDEGVGVETRLYGTVDQLVQLGGFDTRATAPEPIVHRREQTAEIYFGLRRGREVFRTRGMNVVGRCFGEPIRGIGLGLRSSSASTGRTAVGTVDPSIQGDNRFMEPRNVLRGARIDGDRNALSNCGQALAQLGRTHQTARFQSLPHIFQETGAFGGKVEPHDPGRALDRVGVASQVMVRIGGE